MKIKISLLSLLWCFLFSPAVNASIKIGTLIFYPPYITTPGEGFDIDLANLICKRLQETCNFIPMDTTQLYKSLNAGQIDLAIGGISISPSRKADSIFSLPYMVSKGQFLILKNGKITSSNELKGATVGVIKSDLSGSVFYNYLMEHYKGQFQVKVYDNIEDLIAALNNHEITAAFVHRSVVNYWVDNAAGQFKTLGAPILIGDGIAMMALPKNKELIGKINNALNVIEQDGSYLNLYDTYFAQE